MVRLLLSLVGLGGLASPLFAQWVCYPQPPVCLPPVYYVWSCPAPVLAPGSMAKPPTQVPPPKISLEPTMTPARPIGVDRPAPATTNVPPPTDFAKPTPAAPPETPKTTPRLSLDPVPAPAPMTPTRPAIEPGPVTPTGAIAAPKPAAPTDADTVKIPPLIPRLPGVDSGLPPLSLPSPAVPEPSTSRSSPLNAKPQSVVEVFPVDGPPPGSPSERRVIGFFNQTSRDIRLTVNGQTVTLPKKHEMTATVPVTFRWTLDDEPARETIVPTATPGLEIVIRK